MQMKSAKSRAQNESTRSRIWPGSSGHENGHPGCLDHAPPYLAPNALKDASVPTPKGRKVWEGWKT